ncbi:unnamed protein product, partial [Mesorhabditis spiculigera]
MAYYFTSHYTIKVIPAPGQPDPGLLENLQSSDLWRKREAVQTISNLILISDEGANLNVSFRDIVAAIKDLLQNEDFNTKSDGVTCLQNLVDVFSRSHSVAADAIPLLITLMQDVREEYGVDIHETALKPLLILSRKYGRNILQAGGLSGVLRHLYFFNQHAQRSAIEVVANAASYVTPANLDQVTEAFREICDNLNNTDSKMGDAACAAFSRIVCNLYEEETFVNDVLDQKYDLACKIVNVLREVTTKFSATTELLIAVRLLMGCSSDFALKLHHVGATSTIANLLSPLSSKRAINSFIDLRELIYMCGELAPALPDTSIFIIDKHIVNQTGTHRRQHQPAWPSTSSEERPFDQICSLLTAPLVSVAASVTDPVVHFGVIRVLVRLLLPCRHVDLFELLEESEYANPVMLVSLMKDALAYTPQRAHLAVATVQLIRTMLEKDSSKNSSCNFRDHGIWESVERLVETLGDGKHKKAGPVTRTRSKAQQIVDALPIVSRKRTSPAGSDVPTTSHASDHHHYPSSILPAVPLTPFRDDGSPSTKRERDSCGSSRSTAHASAGPKKSPLQLLSISRHGSASTSSMDSGSSPDSLTRQLNEQEHTEINAWLIQECSHALRLRPDVAPVHEQLQKLVSSIRDRKDDLIPSTFFKDLLHLAQQNLTPNQLLHSGLAEEILKWMADGSAMHVVPLIIASLQKIDSADRQQHLNQLIRIVAGAVDLCEAFPVSIFDLTSHASTNLFHGAQALRYFRNHVVTITVSRHPKVDSSDPPQSNTFKTDALVTMKYIYSVVKNRLPIRQSSSSEEEEDSQNGIYQSMDIELLTSNGTVIGQEQVLLEVLLANSPDDIGRILGTAHNFHYRPKKSGNPVRHVDHKMSLEQRIREELSHAPDEHTTLPTASGVTLVAEFLEGKRVFEKNMMKRIDRISQSTAHTNPDEPSQFVPALGMLTLLHYIDQYWSVDGCQGYWPERPFPIASKEAFVCKKLDAKVNRQLADFLSVAAQGLPTWIEWIARNAPYALSFETRRSFFHLTAFGRERALGHWLQQRDIPTEDANFMRVKKVSIEVVRDNFITFAYAALQDTPTGSTMEVKFRGEAGTGHGPTQEFYSILSKEFKKASLDLWYPGRMEVDPETNEKMVASDHGLFPLPCTKEKRVEKIQLYELLGRALGQSLQDGKRLDIVLSPIVMKYLIGKAHLIGPCDLATVDPIVYKSMKQIEECGGDELDLIMADYAVPNVDINISTDSSQQTVTAKNRWTYLERVREIMLLTVREPLEAIAHGLNAVLPRENLECFLPDEFEALFCGADGADPEYWQPNRIIDALKFDLGYSRESLAVKNFVQMLVEFTPAKRQRFLQFVTGSPRLPHGGFAALSPPLTVVCKSPAFGGPDGEFPSAVTCKNYVKLPNYTSYEVMVRQFEIALTNVLHFDYN